MRKGHVQKRSISGHRSIMATSKLACEDGFRMMWTVLSLRLAVSGILKSTTSGHVLLGRVCSVLPLRPLRPLCTVT